MGLGMGKIDRAIGYEIIVAGVSSTAALVND